MNLEELKTHAASTELKFDELKNDGQETNEQVTKNTLVMPFIRDLGYDVEDAAEVFPEFSVGAGEKRGKADYAVLRGGKPIMLFECKDVAKKLSHTERNQLFTYLNLAGADVGILTNGIVYEVFVICPEPFLFLEVDLYGDPAVRIPELSSETTLATSSATAPMVLLELFTKQSFDNEQIKEKARKIGVASIQERKRIKTMKGMLSRQLESPAVDFVEWIARKLHRGKSISATKFPEFAELSKTAFKEFIKEVSSEQAGEVFVKGDKVRIKDTARTDGRGKEGIVKSTNVNVSVQVGDDTKYVSPDNLEKMET